MESWTTKEVQRWLQAEDFAEYADTFGKKKISGKLLVQLTADQFYRLGITDEFHVLSLMASIESAREGTGTASEPEQADEKPSNGRETKVRVFMSGGNRYYTTQDQEATLEAVHAMAVKEDGINAYMFSLGYERQGLALRSDVRVRDVINAQNKELRMQFDLPKVSEVCVFVAYTSGIWGGIRLVCSEKMTVLAVRRLALDKLRAILPADTELDWWNTALEDAPLNPIPDDTLLEDVCKQLKMFGHLPCQQDTSSARDIIKERFFQLALVEDELPAAHLELFDAALLRASGVETSYDVVLNAANIGFAYMGGITFDWEGVRRAVQYYQELNMKVIGVVNSETARQWPIPADLVGVIETTPQSPLGKGVDDVFTISLAMRYRCQYVDNDKYKDWSDDGPPGLRAWLRSDEGISLHINYIFLQGSFQPSVNPTPKTATGIGSSLQRALQSLVAKARTDGPRTSSYALRIKTLEPFGGPFEGVHVTNEMNLAQTEVAVAKAILGASRISTSSTPHWSIALYAADGHPMRAGREKEGETMLRTLGVRDRDILFAVPYQTSLHRGNPLRRESSWSSTFSAVFHGVSPTQSKHGKCEFFSGLFALIEHLIQEERPVQLQFLGHVRALTAFPPLLYALHQLLKKRMLLQVEQVALVEGLNALIKRLYPALADKPTNKQHPSSSNAASKKMPGSKAANNKASSLERRTAQLLAQYPTLGAAALRQILRAENFEVSLKMAKQLIRQMPEEEDEEEEEEDEGELKAAQRVWESARLVFDILLRGHPQHQRTEVWEKNTPKCAISGVNFPGDPVHLAADDAVFSLAAMLRAAAKRGLDQDALVSVFRPAASRDEEYGECDERWSPPIQWATAVGIEPPVLPQASELPYGVRSIRSRYLRVVSPLTLKLHANDKLVRDVHGRLGLSKGHGSSGAGLAYVFDPLTGLEADVNPDELANNLAIAGIMDAGLDEDEAEGETGGQDAEEERGQKVTELIYVLFDISGSMTQNCFPQQRDTAVDEPPSKSVFIGSLPENVSALELRAVVAVFGPVVHCTVPQSNEIHGFNRGIGFVDFMTLEAARKCVEQLKGSKPFKGQSRALNAKFGRPREKKVKDNVDKLSKLDMAKQLFGAYANRSMASDHVHKIGLCLFGSDVSIAMELTRMFEGFKQGVDQVVAHGKTRLLDAISIACDRLGAAKEAADSTVLRRIVCLTDGNDEGSNAKFQEVVTKVQRMNVVVDAVMFGTYSNNDLMSLCENSSGLRFVPSSVGEALALFENELLLSAACRKNVVERKQGGYAPLGKQQRSARTSRGKATVTTPEELAALLVRPASFSLPVQSADRALLRAARDGPSASVQGTPQALRAPIKMVMRQLQRLAKDQLPYLKVYPAEDDVMFWQVLMQGPEATPYAHGVFRLWVQFPADYPLTPPDIRFITPIFHCNISDTGQICHSIIRRHYSSTVDISFIFQNIWSLLSEPSPSDPLNSNRALLYWTDKANYLDQAHAHTLKNSEASCMADAEERLLNPASHRRVLSIATVHAPVLSPGEPPPELLCPLTLQLFQDPVLARPTGIYYERNAILTHLRHGNSFDPVYMSRFNTCIVLSEALLAPAVQMERKVRQFRQDSTPECLQRPWWGDGDQQDANPRIALSPIHEESEPGPSVSQGKSIMGVNSLAMSSAPYTTSTNIASSFPTSPSIATIATTTSTNSTSTTSKTFHTKTKTSSTTKKKAFTTAAKTDPSMTTAAAPQIVLTAQRRIEEVQALLNAFGRIGERLGQVLELHEVEADALVLLTSPHIDRMDLASGERSLLESIIAIAHTWSSDHADG